VAGAAYYAAVLLMVTMPLLVNRSPVRLEN
jgi:hypothetical protein